MAMEIGTWSRPCAPKVTDAPVSRLVATRNSLRPSLRKSSVRPEAANRRRRKSPIDRLSKRPVGTACASVAIDSIAP